MPSESTPRPETPLPWVLEVFADDRPRLMAHCPLVRNPQAFTEEVATFHSKGDAEYALAAVNAYTARDTALDAMRGAMEGYTKGCKCGGTGERWSEHLQATVACSDARCEQARAALALADKLTTGGGE